MTENRIEYALVRLFESHRIVFWYDEKQELRDEFENLEFDNVEKVELNNNEFTLKHRMLREEPKQLFLLYKNGSRPLNNFDNWLLDIELYSVIFQTDQSAIWLSELGLPMEFADLVLKHKVFFDDTKAPKKVRQRKAKLKALIRSDDTRGDIRRKMVAVCSGGTQQADARIEVICEDLLGELAERNDSTFKLIEHCDLTDYLWEQIKRHFGYASNNPTIKDFSIELFKSAYAMSLVKAKPQDVPSLNNDALVFFKSWKDSRRHKIAFESLSKECSSLLNIEEDLNNRDLVDLGNIDYYQLVDRKIISDLVSAVDRRTMTEDEITKWCRERKKCHWFYKFEHLYTAVDVASQFIAQLDTIQLSASSASNAVERYVGQWYKVDQLYRQFIHSLKVSGQITLLKNLVEKVENFYTNLYLLRLATIWQQHVDAMDAWQVLDTTPQRQFFSRYVQPVLDRGNKLCVIISDAFRYEAGCEMVNRISREDRFQASMQHMLSVLPSYTQLGMASLLPNSTQTLSIVEKDVTVTVGDQSSQGVSGRDKILKSALKDRGAAIQANNLMEMNSTDSRELLKTNDVVYVYHNRIDHAGDKMQSEGEAFEATERTFDDLMKLIKKLTNANASNLIITADHGFIYQNQALEESDFSSPKVSGDVYYKDRRFQIGKSLIADASMKHFSADQLGLSGDSEVILPKGIQRLRLSGSGSRFVHGGAMLQEVIVPVISVNKKRHSDIELVEVDILRGGSNTITSGQLSVTLYQTKPVSDKLQARTFRVGIYTESGQLISDQHTVSTDLTAENAREREIKLRFVLTQEAGVANQQEVMLKLQEPIEGTNQFRNYKQLKYTIRRSFTSDFDV